MGIKKETVRTLIKISITVVLLLFLIIKIKPTSIIKVFVNTNFLLIFLSLPIFFLLYILRTIKWNIALAGLNIKLPFWKSFKVILIGTFYGMITPAKTGELARAYYVDHKKSITIPTIMWDKITDIALLIFLSIFVMFFFINDVRLFYMILFIIILTIISLVLAVNKKVIRFLIRIFKINEKAGDSYFESMYDLVKNKKVLIKMFFIGLLFYVISIGSGLIVLKALNLYTNPSTALCLPVLILFGNAPITISGLGLRESVSVLCFMKFGESMSMGFSFSLLWFTLITLLPGLVGYLFLIRKKKN